MVLQTALMREKEYIASPLTIYTLLQARGITRFGYGICKTSHNTGAWSPTKDLSSAWSLIRRESYLYQDQVTQQSKFGIWKVGLFLRHYVGTLTACWGYISMATTLYPARRITQRVSGVSVLT